MIFLLLFFVFHFLKNRWGVSQALCRISIIIILSYDAEILAIGL